MEHNVGRPKYKNKMWKLILGFLLLGMSLNNITGQGYLENSLININSSNYFTYIPKTNWGPKKFIENKITFSISNTLLFLPRIKTKVSIGTNLQFYQVLNFSNVVDIKFRKFYFNPYLQFDVDKFFAIIGYSSNPDFIRSKSHPNSGWTVGIPENKVTRQAICFGLGRLNKVGPTEYIETFIEYRQQFTKGFYNGIDKPVFDYSQNLFTINAQMKTRFSSPKLQLPLIHSISPKGVLYSLNFHSTFANDSLGNQLAMNGEIDSDVGKFLNNRIILGLIEELGFEKTDNQKMTYELYLKPYLKYMFHKNWFANYEFGFGIWETGLNKYNLVSNSLGFGNFFQVSNKSILQAKLAYTFENLFVKKFQPEIGNQINNTVSIELKLFFAL